MDNYRIIKLLLPTGKLINIQLGGDENELKDLISAITDLSPSQIKGIKDSQGNYYTISSAIKSIYMLPSLDDKYYELIWSKQKDDHLSSKKINDNKMQNIILNSTPNVGNYYTNYFINEKTQKKNDFLLNFNPKNVHSNYSDIYLLYLRNFYDKKLITQLQLNDFIRMINTNEHDIIQLFNTFIDSKIDLNELIKNLWILDENYNHKTKKYSPSKYIEVNEDSILSKLELFFNSEDMSIIKEMVQYENEFILEAFREYSQTNIFEELIDTIKKILIHYKNKSMSKKKPKSSLNVNILKKESHLFDSKRFSSHSNSNEKIDKKIEQKLITESNVYKEKNHLQISQKLPHFLQGANAKPKTIKSSKIIQSLKKKKFVKEQLESKTQMKPIIMTSSIVKTSSKKLKSTSKVASLLMEELTDINKIIVRYAKDQNVKEYENIKQIFKTADKKNVKKQLNDYVSKYFQNELIEVGNKNKHILREQDISLLHNFVNSKYPSVVKAFNEFDRHFSISTLEKDLFDIIQREQVNSDSSSSEEGNSEEEDIVTLFINDLDKLQLSAQEKEKIKMRIKSNNSKIMDIITTYSKNKKIDEVKAKLQPLLKSNNAGTILKKLKSRNSPKKLLLQGNKNNDLKPMSLNQTFSNYKEVLSYIGNQNLLSEDSIKLIIEKYKAKDEVVIELFENFFKNNNQKELIDNLNRYLTENAKDSNKLKVQVNPKSDVPKTPDTIKKSKNELTLFLRREQRASTKEKNVLEKQKEIISLLYHKKCINKNTYDLINKKIEEDDQTLIAAFEVYAVTKDHNEFIETLKLIAESSENYKGTFNILLNNSNFNEAQKEILTSLYNEKDENIISALEVYEEKKDREDVYNSFQVILKRNSKK